MVVRTTSGRWTYAFVVISPAITARPVVTSVSQATRDAGSSARRASSTASEMASATLSGWPSVTDSDVKRQRSYTAVPHWGSERKKRGPDTMLPGPGPSRTVIAKTNDSPPLGQPVVKIRCVTDDIGESSSELVPGLLRRERPQGGRRGKLGVRRRDAADDALHERNRSRRDAHLPHAQAEERERHQGLRRHLAADGDVDVPQLRHLDRATNEAQHRRVQRRVPRREIGVPAIDRERVLHEVVGPDAEEVDVLGQRIAGHGRRGCLD